MSDKEPEENNEKVEKAEIPKKDTPNTLIMRKLISFWVALTAAFMLAAQPVSEVDLLVGQTMKFYPAGTHLTGFSVQEGDEYVTPDGRVYTIGSFLAGHPNDAGYAAIAQHLIAVL